MQPVIETSKQPLEEDAALARTERHWLAPSRSHATGAAARLIYALPRPVRWKLARSAGHRSAAFQQWTWDNEGAVSLRQYRERKLLFLHIPKAAGSAVKTSLLRQASDGHPSVEDFLSVFGARFVDEAFKFTFVRDPVTRTSSAFHFLRQGGMNRHDAAFGRAFLAEFADVEDFVRRGLARPEIQSWVHFRSQISFLTDPRDGSLAPDFIGRHESMEADYATLAERLGEPTHLPRVNVTEGRKTPLSAEAQRIVRTVYAQDVEALGY